MKPITLLLALLAFASLACMTAVPATETPAVPTAAPRVVEVPYIEPADVHTDLLAEMCTIVVSTETNLRSCAGMGCEIVGTLSEGATVTAACNSAWAYVPKRGWFCVAAATRTGGCE